MRKAMRVVAGIALAAVALAAVPAQATEYEWSENDRWTILQPTLQILTLQPEDHMWISTGYDPGEKWFADGVQWTNYGTIIWSDTNSPLFTSNNSNLANFGLIDLQTDGVFWRYPGSGGGWNTLSNAAGAVIRKSAGGGDVDLPFNNSYGDETFFYNSGTLDCREGRINYLIPRTYFEDGTRFTGPGVHRIGVSNVTAFIGAITVDPGTTVEFDSRLWGGNPWSPFNGDPATLHGSVRLVCGDLSNHWTIAEDGVVTTVPEIPSRVDGTLINLGTLNVYNQLATNATTTNQGIIDFRADDTRFGRGDSNWPTVINEGVIRKSAGAGRSILGTDGQADLNLTNSAAGVIDVQSGVLSVFAANFNQNAGRLHIAADARLEIAVYWPNPFTHQGVVDGAGTLKLMDLSPLVNQGLVAPGDGVGTLAIEGGLTQEANGELAIELGGAEGGAFDRLAVTGTALLGGRLRVSAVGGFVPGDQATFVILTAADRQQEFSEVVNELPAGRTLEVVYGPTSVTLVVHAVVSDAGDPLSGLGSAPRLSTQPAGVGQTVIALDLPQAARVRVAIYDLAGRVRSHLTHGDLASGRHEWRGSDLTRAGEPLPSGVYFVRAEVAGTGGTARLEARVVVIR